MDWKTHHRKYVNSPQLIHSFNVIPIKISIRLFIDTGRIIIKFTWNDKGARIAKTILNLKKYEEN